MQNTKNIKGITQMYRIIKKLKPFKDYSLSKESQ